MRGVGGNIQPRQPLRKKGKEEVMVGGTAGLTDKRRWCPKAGNKEGGTTKALVSDAVPPMEPLIIPSLPHQLSHGLIPG